MATYALNISNMHCGACVRRVSETLNRLPDTHADEVRIGSARVTTAGTSTAVETALAAAGFPAQLTSTTP